MTTQKEPTYRASTFKLEKSKTTFTQALAKMPNGHALQSWAWAAQKSRWGWTPLPLTLTIGESSWEPLAAAMVLKRKIPRTPYCILYVPKGPALDYKDGALRRVVLAELEKIARQERAIFIKIDPEVVKSWGDEVERPSPLGSKFTQELKDRGWRFSDEQIQFRNTVELDLTQSEETLLAAMKSKTRYNIRLAGRKGIVVRAGNEADFPIMAEMYAETAVRDGFGIRPAAYYLDAWQSFHQAGMGHLLIAEFERDPVAAVYLVKYGQRVIYMYGASTDKERQRMPNHLLQWEAIRWAKAQGCTIYDFWGAPDEFGESDRLWGVWRFKEGFSGQVVRHIGAWDFAVRPLLYQLYTVVLPKYLNYLRRKKQTGG
ncbi:MAG: peptidoglycan bridge formation glycyltransferase FemA/FemB family protein [Candidatus Promineifilaceae bacterium]|nr:peptidoglycan bridge formation glycyltransferase FemA/FemB family protein [Anaerolineaceae bacterium]